MARLFLAVSLPPAVNAEIERVVERMKSSLPDVRWTSAGNRHLTLVFLGETAADRMALLPAQIKDAVRGHAAFRASLEGLGVFPSAARPRVLWAGVREGAAPLKSLADHLSDVLRRAGYRLEERAYHPHVTLSRLERPAALDGFLREFEQKAFGHFTVSDIHLMSSHLTPRGAAYASEGVFPLTGQEKDNLE